MRILFHGAHGELDRRVYWQLRRAVRTTLGDTAGHPLRLEVSFAPGTGAWRCRLRLEVAGRPGLVADGSASSLVESLVAALERLEGWLPGRGRV